MFNRNLEFKITRPTQPGSPPSPLTEDEKIERFVYIQETTRTVVKDVAKLVAGYMLLDTYRKATIAKAAKTCCTCIKH